MPKSEIARLYNNSNFYNYGYWKEDTQNQGEASALLVEKLLEWLPEKTGNILDVACGIGGSTKLLQNYYKPEDIVAMNYSPSQLEAAQLLAPGSSFVCMDAAILAFPDESFDNIICVEAAFHFNTRQQFFDEAFRLLKPGGRLVHSDILTRRHLAVPDNSMRVPSDLAERLRRSGFENVEVIDATRECWGGFCNHLKRFPGQEWRAKRGTTREYVVASIGAVVYRLAAGRVIQYYTLSGAQKPVAL